MLKIGHRGALGYAPENTLLSFQKAIDLGVDMVELDVYVCKTGELVVIHDDRLERTTNGEGYIWEKTLSELKELDAGEGQKIPTLVEVFDLVNKKVKINIELKGEGTAQPVAKMIREYIELGWDEDMFFVSSFNHHELKKFKELMPNVKIGALIVANPLDYAKFGSDLNAWSINLCIEFINQAIVDDAHGRGLKVLVWTVNNPEDIERMKKLNVDGIFSNFPDRI
ncbi:MAG: glycerophosphodiester phosphodiesterase family protein [Candidatus Buchananbacteria bacterium]